MATVRLVSESTLHFRGLATEVASCLQVDKELSVVNIISILANHSVTASSDEVWEALMFLEENGHVTLNKETQSAILTPKGLKKSQSKSILVYMFDPVYGTNVSI